MFKLLALCLAITLSGCATTNSVGGRICGHRSTAEVALNMALTQAYSIADLVKREAAISAINVSLAALTKCPSNGSSVAPP
jgi:hypothetical protein